MHLTRKEATNLLPIPQKGTKYLVRTRSNLQDSVSILAAVRDILKLARNSREVKAMIHNKLLKLNGRQVRDFRESVRLFNLLEAGKTYRLNLLPTKKFSLEETKEKDQRLCKVIGRKLLSKGQIQLNLHDGTNIITKDKISVGDTVYIDLSNKIKKHISLDKATNILVYKGSYAGRKAKIESIKNKMVKIKVEGKEAPTEIHQSQVIAL